MNIRVIDWGFIHNNHLAVWCKLMGFKGVSVHMAAFQTQESQNLSIG